MDMTASTLSFKLVWNIAPWELLITITVLLLQELLIAIFWTVFCPNCRLLSEISVYIPLDLLQNLPKLMSIVESMIKNGYYAKASEIFKHLKILNKPPLFLPLVLADLCDLYGCCFTELNKMSTFIIYLFKDIL